MENSMTYKKKSFETHPTSLSTTDKNNNGDFALQTAWKNQDENDQK